MMDNTILITFHNETYIRVTSERSIEYELRDYFSFKVESSEYMKRRNPKLKYWDSKIYLYNKMTKFIRKGLLIRVLEFAQNRGYDVFFTNKDHDTNDANETLIRDFTQSTRIMVRNAQVSLKDYQQDAVNFALMNDRALLLSPTSSGKSAIIYTMIKWHIQHDRKILLVVPSTLLVDQMYSDFNEYEPNFATTNCQKLYSGKTKVLENKVLITTWQSIFNQSKQYLEQFDVVIGDEAHGLTSKEVSKFLDNMTKTRYRIGTTGTTNGSKCHMMELEGIFGRLLKVITTKELMDSGAISNMTINMIMLDHDCDAHETYKKREYLDELKFLINIEKRNKFIVDLIKSKKTDGTTLVLFNLVEHGKKLFSLLTNELPNVFFIDGSVNVDDREAIRTGVNDIKNSVIVASSGTMKQGVSITSIDTVIFVTPPKARITILQSIGRGLRKHDGKASCTVYDIFDNLPKCFSKSHAKERAKLYKSEKFEVTLMKHQL